MEGFEVIVGLVGAQSVLHKFRQDFGDIDSRYECNALIENGPDELASGLAFEKRENRACI